MSMSQGFKVFLLLVLVFTAFWVYQLRERDLTEIVRRLEGDRPPAAAAPLLPPLGVSRVDRLLPVAWTQEPPAPEPIIAAGAWQTEEAPVELPPASGDDPAEGSIEDLLADAELVEGAEDGSAPDAPAPIGLAPPPAPETRPEPGPDKPVEHIVRKGERLWTIARKHGGSGQDAVDRIVAANRDIIRDPNRLKEGWKLVIPPF